MASSPRLSRRRFLRDTSLLAASVLPIRRAWRGGRPRRERLKVAAVFTTMFYHSHAHVILENFVAPYLFNGRWIVPELDVVSLYADQFPSNDLARQFSAIHGIPIYPTIAGALGRGKDELAVDAVLSIGEHGNYPLSEIGQVEYPRKRFFDEIVAVFRRSGRVVPLYSDKHLSYRWDWAKEMYDTSREMGIPFMAASSVPLAERRPPLELPPGAEIEEAMSVNAGGTDAYDFHGMEVLQSMVEARKGGETGVSRIQVLSGKALWDGAASGLWSPELAAAALGRPFAEVKPQVRSALLVTYRSGLRGTEVILATDSAQWHFACRLAGERRPRATRFYTGPWGNRTLFKALSHAIQTHFREKRAPIPIERTLLTTGIVQADMVSRSRGGAVVETPHLGIAYTAKDFRAMREMGASWRILNDSVPEPQGLEIWRPPPA